MSAELITETVKEISVSKEIDWLRPFIEYFCYIVPKSERLKEVRVLQPKAYQYQDCSAYVIENDKGEYFITIYSGVWEYRFTRKGEIVPKYLPKTRREIVWDLAHELVHMKLSLEGVAMESQDHDIDFYANEIVVMDEFLALLEEMGFESDEADLRGNRKRPKALKRAYQK